MTEEEYFEGEFTDAFLHALTDTGDEYCSIKPVIDELEAYLFICGEL